MAKTPKDTHTHVKESLPTPPPHHHYEVEQMSPLVTRVWLCHERDYVWSDEPVKTVYCFVKGGKVYPPKNYKTARPKSVGLLIDLKSMSPYTTIVPTTTSLLHLL